MRKMSHDEYVVFMQTPRTGKIATVREDGRPHVVPVWFLLDGEEIVFTTWHTAVKRHNIEHNPHVALCVDDDHLPYDFVTVEGMARVLVLPPEDMRRWATEIARRYVGDEKAEAFGKRNGVEGELLVRLTPTHIIAQKGIAD
ncbi:MAG TPA: PPOX class F420-dependent oxidoreductase [Aggregatilinea sp.]|uniref:PPOX class F420-dependent oxidoreductase n=1 Tax=Aggregatilinea sp. TaxID=2806333 RepID=UPI002C9D1654|nr:PPOX class F420-dependent oxidoreductase [Aggregatilinea sp.]HML21453.1 PPOX class F420-dependent oxidoreductase [Aggregatilinea sp.]